MYSNSGRDVKKPPGIVRLQTEIRLGLGLGFGSGFDLGKD